MSRSGYSSDCGGWELIMWRGAVNSAIRGKRGQAFLREMLAALDALPEKRLVESVLVSPEGCCAIGSVAISRQLDVSDVDVDDKDSVAAAMGIAPALAAEIAFMNDDDYCYQTRTDEKRWEDMRAWVVENLKLNRKESDDADT